MSTTVINDPLRINSVAKIGGVVTDITGEEAFFDYFKPDNATGTPDGTYTAVVVVGTDGEFYYDILQDTLNEVGAWKFQPSFTYSGDTYHEQNPTCHNIVAKGASCS